MLVTQKRIWDRVTPVWGLLAAIIVTGLTQRSIVAPKFFRSALRCG